MNKDLEDLQQYIETVSMPASYSPLFEDCKDVSDEKCEDFKAILDRLKSCKADMTAAIINEINFKINSERLIVCFIFAVYAKHRAEEGVIQNADIIKALPPIDFEKCWCATGA